MKFCHEMRSIDQGMVSELALSDPKWGVATRVVVGDRCSLEHSNSEAAPLAFGAPCPGGLELIILYDNNRLYSGIEPAFILATDLREQQHAVCGEIFLLRGHTVWLLGVSHIVTPCVQRWPNTTRV